MLRSISLQNFRNYKKSSFEFNNSIIIIGPNTCGKSNLIEGIYLLSSGKSFRAEKDSQMVRFGSELGRVKAHATPRFGGQGKSSDIELEVVVTVGEVGGVRTQFKKFLVNGVAKRRADFVGNMPAVLFSPRDLEIIVGSPGLRREFLDNVLEQTDRDYRLALLGFTKALRQRNALLELVKNGLRRNEREFEYWDSLVIRNGQVLTSKREEFIDWLNTANKDILDFRLEYDKSVISYERLEQYHDAERASGVTLVGPHRDDLWIRISPNGINANKSEFIDLKLFGSRGQQRLGVLQLKLLELDFVRSRVENEPILLLDDVFSELDEDHIKLILTIRDNQQTIITTTHEEFIPGKIKGTMEIIELK
ncbi:MAG: DNA replication and repair protein RecF [Candidatus Levybacteria bacterium]|nr:DNA replication and repair protein RecF [Candidatus Levybacteria bacterium]